MQRPLTQHIDMKRGPMSLSDYEAIGGYQSLSKIFKESGKDIIKTISDSGLMGRGGAGFNTGFKMSAVPQGENAPKIKYLICNADEMEPGTFKDRWLMEGAPHQLVEGMIVAAYAIQATVAYIFLRGEYKVSQRALEKAVHEAYAKGYLGTRILGSDYSLEMHVHMSAGRYICGEETALINALEGRRAIPRAKPPFPQTSGLWGKPTLVQNVETLSNLSHIVNNGAAWFKSLGLANDAGTKIFGVSGKVKNPGAFELPMGTPGREIFETHAGGMRDGLKFKAYLPGGASTDFLLDAQLDLPMEYTSYGKAGTRMGTGQMVILDDQTCPVGMLLNLESFFKQESCGFCTPCRDGLSWTARTLLAIESGKGEPKDVEVLQRHAKLLGPGNTFCALAPGAASPLMTGLKHFADEFEEHIRDKRCRYENIRR
jgi:NADH-quinone oxidoreductase subunit F